MELSFLFVVCLLILGAFGGFLAGLLGVGGGMVLVPFLTLLFNWKGLDSQLLVHSAIATSMSMILFTSLSSMRAHNKQGGVMWKVVFLFVPGILIGGLVAGGLVFPYINMAWLALIFSIFVGYSAINMLRNKKPKPTRNLPGPAGMIATGSGIGFLSGLVGAGGGFMSVPFMVWCNVPLRNAVATSAALGFPIAVGNSVGYIISGLKEVGVHGGMFGYVYWPGLLILIVMSTMMAPVGAKLAHTLPVPKLRRFFAYLLFFICLFMLRKSLVAFGVFG